MAKSKARQIEDMEDIIDPLLMRKKSGKYIAAVLSAAGSGLVADAKREAWDEGYEGAAKAIQKDDPANHVVWLRSRAAEMRQS